MSRPQRDFKLFGLTGGVASGKTTVAAYFKEQGIPVIDADQVSRQIIEPGGVAEQTILKRFGTNDRRKLREIIFEDSQAKKDLEAITHPLIIKESERQIIEAAAKIPSNKPRIVLYEATLLIETGRYKDMDRLILVEGQLNARLQRLMERDKTSASLARQMITSQLSDEEKRQKADYVIENFGSVDELRIKAAKVLSLIMQEFKK